jgi:hypothetical protein
VARWKRASILRTSLSDGVERPEVPWRVSDDGRKGGLLEIG